MPSALFANREFVCRDIREFENGGGTRKQIQLRSSGESYENETCQVNVWQSFEFVIYLIIKQKMFIMINNKSVF